MISSQFKKRQWDDLKAKKPFLGVRGREELKEQESEEWAEGAGMEFRKFLCLQAPNLECAWIPSPSRPGLFLLPWKFAVRNLTYTNASRF